MHRSERRFCYYSSSTRVKRYPPKRNEAQSVSIWTRWPVSSVTFDGNSGHEEDAVFLDPYNVLIRSSVIGGQHPPTTTMTIYPESFVIQRKIGIRKGFKS